MVASLAENSKKKVMMPDLLTHNVVSSAAPEALLRHQQRC